MTLDHRFQQLERVRGTLSLLLSPLQYLVHLPITGVQWASGTITTQQELLEENSRLKEEQLHLSAQMLKYLALESENIRLRELLESSTKIQDKVLISEVLQVEVNSLKRQILINKGSHDAVYLGQTVIDADGVVGQVIHVAPYTSTVMLITNPDHAIPVQVARNGIRTIAVGSREDYLLDLPYLATNADVKNGDQLITSGLGGRFPYGYPVATVHRVQQDDTTSFSSVQAQPNARLDRHREVLLVFPTGNTEGPEQP